MAISAFLSQKGGVSKTTSCLSVGAALAHHFKKKVLIIDLDPQANSSKTLLREYQKIDSRDTIVSTILPRDEFGNDDLSRQTIPVTPTPYENLDIIPSHIMLAESDLRLSVAVDDRVMRLKRALESVKNVYQEILIDCPPSLGWLSLNALAASDNVITPVSPGFFEMDSVNMLNRTIEMVRKNWNPDLKLLKYVFTMSQPTRISKESLQILRQTFGNYVANAVIPRNVDLADSVFNRQTIFEYSPTCAGAMAYLKLTKELYSL